MLGAKAQGSMPLNKPWRIGDVSDVPTHRHTVS